MLWAKLWRQNSKLPFADERLPEIVNNYRGQNFRFVFYENTDQKFTVILVKARNLFGDFYQLRHLPSAAK